VLPVVGLAGRRFWEQNMFHHTAALTYYTVMALGQSMLLVVGLLGVLGSDRTIAELDRFLTRAGIDAGVAHGMVTAASDAIERRGASAVALAFAVGVALFVSSSAFVGASTALNVVLEAPDHRGPVRRRSEALLATLVVLLLGTCAMIAVLLGGSLAAEVFDVIGLGDTAETAWKVARFPIAGALALTAFAWTYYAAPSVGRPRWHWISLGATMAMTAWLAGSVALFVFTANFDAYDTTYGSFATAIVLVAWLWLTNAAMLFGAEVNAAGRYAEAAGTPMTETGDSPEEAQHKAATRRA